MAERGCLKDGQFQNLQVEGPLFNTSTSGVGHAYLVQNGAPLSGTTAGTHKGVVEPNGYCFDRINRVTYINEGTKASPYWSPVNIRDRGLRGVSAQMVDGDGAPRSLAITTTSTIVGHNTRVCGQGIAETDSGIVIISVDDRTSAEVASTNEGGHNVALTMGANGALLQPNLNGPLTVDCQFSNPSIANRNIFVGFQNKLVDACGNPVQGAGTEMTFDNATNTADDSAGMFLSTTLTKTTKIFLPHVKDDAAGVFQTSASVGGANNGIGTVAAVDELSRWRLQVDVLGGITAFLDKAEVGFVLTALEPSEELVPVFCLTPRSDAVAKIDVIDFSVFASKSLT